MKAKYRILNADKTFFGVASNIGSWFNLEDARKLCDYEIGQMIVEHDGMNILWEVL